MDSFKNIYIFLLNLLIAALEIQRLRGEVDQLRSENNKYKTLLERTGMFVVCHFLCQKKTL